jgi:hypothetical protein
MVVPFGGETNGQVLTDAVIVNVDFKSPQLVGGALMFGFVVLSDHYGIHWNRGPKTHTSMPVWIQRLLLALIVGGYGYYVVLPWILKKPPVGLNQLLLRLLRAGRKDEPAK